MIMVAMSYFCRQNVSQISLEIVANCSHHSEILAYEISFNQVTNTLLYVRLYVVIRRIDPKILYLHKQSSAYADALLIYVRYIS